MKYFRQLLLALSIFGAFVVSAQAGADDWRILASGDVRVAEEILGRPDANGLSYLEEFDAIRLEVERMRDAKSSTPEGDHPSLR